MSNKLAQMGNNMDERYSAAGVLRTQLNKVFPTHWSFMLGEMALYLSLIHISEPTRQAEISYAVFCLKKKK